MVVGVHWLKCIHIWHTNILLSHVGFSSLLYTGLQSHFAGLQWVSYRVHIIHTRCYYSWLAGRLHYWEHTDTLCSLLLFYIIIPGPTSPAYCECIEGLSLAVIIWINAIMISAAWLRHAYYTVFISSSNQTKHFFANLTQLQPRRHIRQLAP